MASGAPPGSAIQSSENDSTSTPLSWEGDKMFHIYIHDYCSKRGYTKTARELVLEADIPHDSQPPINAKQGLLFEWWSVFWTLFTAKNNGQGSDEALLYTQHQANQNALRQQNRNQPQQAINSRILNGIPRQAGAMAPNGQLPNGLGPAGMAGGQVGMSNGIQTHIGFPMSNPSGHAPNGLSSGGPGGPAQPHNISQMMPGQRPIGVGPPGQQNSTGMVQMGPGAQMNRMLPPNGPPNMGNPMGSTQQAHSPGYQQMGRPSSRPNTPGSQNMMSNPSPSITTRVPPNGMGGMMISDVPAEFMRIPAALYAQLRQEAGLGDKDAGSLTLEEKQRVVYIFRQKNRAGAKPAQQGPNIAGPSSTPSMQPANLRNPSQVRPNKRSSTSPGEDADSTNRTEGSPPEKKRMRPSPSGGEHPLPPGPSQQQVQQQLQQPQPPPMAPMAPFNHPQGGPGSQQMQSMVRIAGAPMNFPQGGMNIPMNQGMMPPMGSPGMMPHPAPTMMNSGQLNPQIQTYRQSMHNFHKTLPPGALGTLIPGSASSPQSNSQQQQGGAPQFGSGNMNPGPPGKTVGSMMPPPSPGMNKAQQPNTGKDGSVNPDTNNRPESSPQTPAMGQPGGQSQGGGPPQQQQAPPSQQQQSSGQQSAGPGTAPQTPVSNPGSGMEPSQGLLGNNSQQPGGTVGSVGTDNLFPPDFLREMVGFEGGFLGGEGGDINFERDFGQWFNPDEMQLP